MGIGIGIGIGIDNKELAHMIMENDKSQYL